MSGDTNFSLKAVVFVAAAYASYGIGSGFATGQEVIQHFASWGAPACFIALILCFATYAYYCGSCYRAGLSNDFTKESDAYVYFCGKYLGRAIDYFSVVLVFLFIIAMFSGCSSTINQFFGIDPIIGAIIMGLASGLTVALGLRKVQDILGCLGVVFIIYIVFFGIYALIKADVSLAVSTINLPQYVAEGKVMQVTCFGIASATTSGLSYGCVGLITAFPFLVSLGKRVNSNREATISGISTGFFYTLAAMLVVFIILFNLDFVAENGVQVPLLAAIQSLAPGIAWSFAIILMLGIYTTITGYIWFVGGRFAPDKTTKSRLIAAALAVVGVFGGYIIPFNAIVNVLYPVTGYAGAILMICMIVKDVKLAKAAKQAKNEACGENIV